MTSRKEWHGIKATERIEIRCSPMQKKDMKDACSQQGGISMARYLLGLHNAAMKRPKEPKAEGYLIRMGAMAWVCELERGRGYWHARVAKKPDEAWEFENPADAVRVADIMHRDASVVDKESARAEYERGGK